MASSFAICCLAIIVTYAQCQPTAALWDPKVKAKCWHVGIQTHINIFTGSYLAFMDLVLALLPTTIIWSLQMNWRKKAGLCLILGLGVFAFICGCIKTSKLPGLGSRPDITWETVVLWVWHATEVNAIIISGCIPTLRPVFLLIFRRPGRAAYVRRKGHEHDAAQAPGIRTGRVSAPSDDSTTAIGQNSSNESWLEASDDGQSRAGKGGIRRTIELDVVSRAKRDSFAYENFPREVGGRYAI